ncbi:YebO family protein [Rouxiella sp. WC2420]|uniref:YebO family protein n=1 Tax=Rouxiella sp. WC2420 TaxID=3234145 RepID=A0AB39VN58_9GAMM
MFDQFLGQTSLATIVLGLLSALIFLLVWFVVNRASVKANRQVQLLTEIAEQQRRQTELLEVLAKAQGKGVVDEYDDDSVSGLRGFIPKR